MIKIPYWLNIQSQPKKTIKEIYETGLDFYYNYSNKNDQISSFEKHIEISLQHSLPLVIHSREAEKKTKEILYSYKNNSNLTGVIHCFTGTEKFAKQMMDIGFYISFSGIITFKNSTYLREIVSRIDRDKILVETDSPYLSPVPFRGKRNEPSYIINTVKKGAEIFSISSNSFSEITSKNFNRLFKKASI